MKRRHFVKIGLAGSVGFSFLPKIPTLSSHILTLSFDDGIRDSSYLTAEIHEKYGLKACINVVASGHMEDFVQKDEWLRYGNLGNFRDWNYLQKRGHEIMPHSWEHLNLTSMPLSEAKEYIDRCLDYFEQNLRGFRRGKAIWNFAYNASNEEIEGYLLTQVRALRTNGWSIFGEAKVNPIPNQNENLVLGCIGHGPDNGNDFVTREVDSFLKSDGGWLVINLHGLDNQGWGPINSRFLDELLARLVKVDYLDILPVGHVLDRVQPG